MGLYVDLFYKEWNKTFFDWNKYHLLAENRGHFMAFNREFALHSIRYQFLSFHFIAFTKMFSKGFLQYLLLSVRKKTYANI